MEVDWERRLSPRRSNMPQGSLEPWPRRVSGGHRYRTGESAHHVFDELASRIGEGQHADAARARGGQGLAEAGVPDDINDGPGSFRGARHG